MAVLAWEYRFGNVGGGWQGSSVGGIFLHVFLKVLTCGIVV